MKATIFQGAGKIELQERDIPKCGDNDAILKNRMACVCGTDVHAYMYGGAPYYIFDGGEFGHEMVSEIVELGKNVKDLKIGDRVFPFPTLCAPNGARSCTLGGFSEYVHVIDAKKDYNLYVLDDSISDEEGAQIEPLSVGWRAAVKTKPEAGQNGIVLGAGGISVGAAMSLKSLGCEKVMIIGRGKARLDIVGSLGFETCSTKDSDWKEQMKAYFGEVSTYGGGKPNVQIVVDAAGTEVLLADMLDMLPYEGTLGVVAVYLKPVPINLMALTYGELEIIGSGGQRDSDVRAVIDTLKSKRFDVGKLATKTFRIDGIEEAIKAAGNSEAVKVFIDYR
jgi:threonine dehydrogenase-like Zn-dependent dehydrogenase